MRLPTDIRYAIRIIFELHGAKKPLSIAYISEKTGIAPRTVENIHAVLRQQGITTGTVGARGGIELAVPFETLSLGRVIETVDYGIEFSICSGDRTNECPNMYECAMRSTWDTISGKIQEELNNILLEDILREYTKSSLGFKHKAECIDLT